MADVFSQIIEKYLSTADAVASVILYAYKSILSSFGRFERACKTRYYKTVRNDDPIFFLGFREITRRERFWTANDE